MVAIVPLVPLVSLEGMGSWLCSAQEKTTQKHPRPDLLAGVNAWFQGGGGYSAGPMFSAISPTPSTRPVILSPATTAPTPSGVPV